MSEYTLEDLKNRHSVRSYLPKNLSGDIISRLHAEVTMTNTHEAGLNFQLVIADGGPFEGFTRSYGMFRNAVNYLACVVDPSFPNTYERAGFFAEKFVMKAVSLGLGTCFVGGTFSAENVEAQMHIYERLPFIVSFGIPAEKTQTTLSSLAMKMVHRHDLKPRDFFAGDDTAYADAKDRYPFIEKGLQAVACAPSSLNKQPVRIGFNADGNLEAFTVGGDDKSSIDLGIAKFNFAEASDAGEWEWGEHAIFLPF